MHLFYFDGGWRGWDCCSNRRRAHFPIPLVTSLDAHMLPGSSSPLRPTPQPPAGIPLAGGRLPRYFWLFLVFCSADLAQHFSSCTPGNSIRSERWRPPNWWGFRNSIRAENFSHEMGGFHTAISHPGSSASQNTSFALAVIINCNDRAPTSTESGGLSQVLWVSLFYLHYSFKLHTDNFTRSTMPRVQFTFISFIVATP
jgi:hypothetical protein